MAEIFVNGKCYHVTHNRLEKDHNFNNKYDFAKNAHVVYTIEYTTNKAVFDKIGVSDFDYNWYDIQQFDNLNEAIKRYVALRFSENVLYVQMFTDVYHNGEIILEECKDNVMQSIMDKHTLKRLENAEKEAEFYKEKYERLQKFVDMYHIDDTEIDRRLRENQK
jgi:hypothetical protein